MSCQTIQLFHSHQQPLSVCIQWNTFVITLSFMPFPSWLLLHTWHAMILSNREWSLINLLLINLLLLHISHRSGDTSLSCVVTVSNGQEEMGPELQHCVEWLRAYFSEPWTVGRLPLPVFHHPTLHGGLSPWINTFSEPWLESGFHS